MSPTNPNVVYVNTQFDGFYKTVDGGAHWTGGDWGGLNLVMDPNKPNVMYGASGPFDHLLKTTDGGNTWSDAADGLSGALVFTIAIDPHDSNVLYAGSTGQGAFKSTDAGATCKPINADSNVNALLVDPDDSNIVYVGSDGHGVLKSTNGGRSFVRIGSPRVTSILSLAKSGQTLYAGTATQGVSESIDGGAPFSPKSIGLPGGETANMGFLQVNPQRSNVLYLGTEASGLFKSTDAAETWFPINLGLGGNTHYDVSISGLVMDPESPDTLYATTVFHSVYKTSTGGR
jgi:hypothetical protein